MPRHTTIAVSDYPELQPARRYRVRVVSARPRLKAQLLVVELHHSDREQDGRPHTIELPIPVRPNGITASFLRACGVAVEPHSEIDPKAAVGAEIEVAFAMQGGALQPAAFHALRE